MIESSENKNDYSGLKNAHSILQVKGKIEDVEKYIFYIIPSCEEELFLKNPSLINTSLNAKAFYQVSTEIYNLNPEKYDNDIEHNFENLVNIMGVITEIE